MNIERLIEKHGNAKVAKFFKYKSKQATKQLRKAHFDAQYYASDAYRQEDEGADFAWAMRQGHGCVCTCGYCS